MTKCFESKYKQDKTRKVHNIRHKYWNNLCSLQQYKWYTIKIIMIPAINNQRTIRSNFMSIIDFFISCWKNWPFLRSDFGIWGWALVAVVVVERLKQETIMYELPTKAGTGHWHLTFSPRRLELIWCFSKKTLCWSPSEFHKWFYVAQQHIHNC